jgi:sugar lactone lactonase YvrE
MALARVLVLAVGIAAGCASSESRHVPGLAPVATFADRQPAGVAVSPGGRLFVSFPYWSSAYDGALVEVLGNGTVIPYPDRAWNAWREGSLLDPASHFVCVQSVLADRHGRLWVLDPAAPRFAGPVPYGPKLVQIDLRNDRVVRVIRFGTDVAPAGSYLNDLRIDPSREFAYVTDSGLGALVIVDLTSGGARRVLTDHVSTRAESGVVPVIEGRELRGPDGKVPQFHADGIALDAAGRFLYYRALTGRRLYRVPTRALLDTSADPGKSVEDLGEDALCDGMIMDRGGSLYLSAVEQNAILVRVPPSPGVQQVLSDPRLAWPDTFAFGPDGALYVTASQIHRMAMFAGGTDRFEKPFAVYRVDPELLR